MTNVQDNFLKFRSTFEDCSDISYNQCGYTEVTRHYGITEKPGGEDTMYESVVHLGAATTEEDSLLVFPNFLQHKVSDFELVDKTQPGTRKILCFFLINPYEQVRLCVVRCVLIVVVYVCVL